MNALKEIGQIIFDIQSKDKLEHLLSTLFTQDELIEFKKRIEILQLLNEQLLSQREIAKKLGVGIATITRGSNALKTAHPQLKKILHEIKG